MRTIRDHARAAYEAYRAVMSPVNVKAGFFEIDPWSDVERHPCEVAAWEEAARAAIASAGELAACVVASEARP